MKRNKYSKIRLLISMAFGFLLLFALYQLIVDYFTFNPELSGKFGGGPYKSEFQIYKEYFESILLIIAPILFAFNKKWSDYISFAIFIFIFGGLISVRTAECSEMIGFIPCMENLFLSKDSWVLLIFCSPLVYLTISLVKNIGKK